jgi:hypothetical protein
MIKSKNGKKGKVNRQFDNLKFLQKRIMGSILEKELQYYIDNQEDLVKQYKGKFLVIKDQKIIGILRLILFIGSHDSLVDEAKKL